MVVFNRTFYDLNHERGYCVDGAPGFPPETISDLKISVPNDTEHILIRGLYLKDEVLRLTLTAKSQHAEKPVALFTTDIRSSLRIGEPYPLRSVDPACCGLVVFGPGIRNDFTENRSFAVSEECLTRYRPSGIPYAGLTCDNIRLAGEVRILGGDEFCVTTEGVDIDLESTPFAIAGRALRIRLVDTGVVDTTNPIVRMANGINEYFGLEGNRGPIFKLFGALPDSDGEVRVLFDSHFHFAGVVSNFNEDDPVISRLAIGTDLTMDDVCGSGMEKETGEAEEQCSPRDIRFETVNCEDTP